MVAYRKARYFFCGIKGNNRYTILLTHQKYSAALSQQSLCELAKQAGNTSGRGADHAAQQATIDSTHAEYGRG